MLERWWFEAQGPEVLVKESLSNGLLKLDVGVSLVPVATDTYVDDSYFSEVPRDQVEEPVAPSLEAMDGIQWRPQQKLW